MKQSLRGTDSSHKASGSRPGPAQQSVANGNSAFANRVLQLQQQYGNAGTTKMLSDMLQRKSAVIQRLSSEEKDELKEYVETQLASQVTGYDDKTVNRIILIIGNGDSLDAAKKAADQMIGKWIESGALKRILPTTDRSISEELKKSASEGAAEISPNLQTATIKFVGSRWNAHLVGETNSDDTAEITKDKAIEYIRAGKNLSYLVGRDQVYDQNVSKSYSIKYGGSKLSIIFSTSDAGKTLHVFHIGPGG